MAHTITEVLDTGNDVLIVKAFDTDETQPDDWSTADQGEWSPTVVEATGWVSATTNHYDPDAYDEDGHLIADAKPRTMTAAEVGEYALSLLTPAAPAATQVPVSFVVPS